MSPAHYVQTEMPSEAFRNRQKIALSGINIMNECQGDAQKFFAQLHVRCATGIYGRSMARATQRELENMPFTTDRDESGCSTFLDKWKQKFYRLEQMRAAAGMGPTCNKDARWWLIRSFYQHAETKDIPILVAVMEALNKTRLSFDKFLELIDTRLEVEDVHYREQQAQQQLMADSAAQSMQFPTPAPTTTPATVTADKEFSRQASRKKQMQERLEKQKAAGWYRNDFKSLSQADQEDWNRCYREAAAQAAYTGRPVEPPNQSTQIFHAVKSGSDVTHPSDPILPALHMGSGNADEEDQEDSVEWSSVRSAMDSQVPGMNMIAPFVNGELLSKSSVTAGIAKTSDSAGTSKSSSSAGKFKSSVIAGIAKSSHSAGNLTTSHSAGTVQPSDVAGEPKSSDTAGPYKSSDAAGKPSDTAGYFKSSTSAGITKTSFGDGIAPSRKPAGDSKSSDAAGTVKSSISAGKSKPGGGLGSKSRASSPTSVIFPCVNSNRFAALALDMDDDDEDDGSAFADPAVKPLMATPGGTMHFQGLSPSASNLVRGVTAGAPCGVSAFHQS